MGESDLTAYERKTAELNIFLSEYGITPIGKKHHNNLKLREILNEYENGNSYSAALLSLSAIERDNDCKRFSDAYWMKEAEKAKIIREKRDSNFC